jgi:hypothetical protein
MATTREKGRPGLRHFNDGLEEACIDVASVVSSSELACSIPAFLAGW